MSAVVFSSQKYEQERGWTKEREFFFIVCVCVAFMDRRMKYLFLREVISIGFAKQGKE